MYSKKHSKKKFDYLSKEMASLIVSFLFLSEVKNESKFNYRQIRNEYFDIWIHFYTRWHDKKKILLNLTLLYVAGQIYIARTLYTIGNNVTVIGHNRPLWAWELRRHDDTDKKQTNVWLTPLFTLLKVCTLHKTQQWDKNWSKQPPVSMGVKAPWRYWWKANKRLIDTTLSNKITRVPSHELPQFLVFYEGHFLTFYKKLDGIHKELME